MPSASPVARADRAALLRRADRELGRTAAVDELCPRGEIGRVEQMRRLDLVHTAFVGDIGLDVEEGELHRLDLEM